jgi:hypothetical protein
VRLYHYTCSHGADRILIEGRLKANPHPLLPGPPLIWLTDLDTPDRAGLGLTSQILPCDRTEFRFAVDTDAAVHWPRFARVLSRSTREQLEAAPGALPMHWWVAGPEPISVLAEVAS